MVPGGVSQFGVKLIDNHSHLRLNYPMYVCICKAVTDREIRKAAAKGADNLYELRESLGVASGCGGCADHAQEILDEATARRRGPTTYIPTPI